MSYSRWSFSRWYTYWCVAQGDAVENRDTARFSYHDAAAGISADNDRWFAAAEIRESVESCVAKVTGAADCTAAEATELRAYMLAFLAAVDARYP